jgi:hypothetical protein
MLKLTDRQDARLLKYADVQRPKDRCWEWRGPMFSNGYGLFNALGREHVAHRVVYEQWWGRPVAIGKVLDHVCRNPACVNPYHLEEVTQRENTMRGTGPSAANAKKTHCLNGHEFTPENTRVRASGKRECRECLKRLQREQWKRGARSHGPNNGNGSGPRA